MTKFLLTSFCIIFAVIYFVETAWLSPTLKSSGGKIKITVEYETIDNPINECNNECKGKCNETCGPDARCRYKCYIEKCQCPGKGMKYQILNEDYELAQRNENTLSFGCTTKCREYCNRTCGEDLKCREKCYVKTCQCPPLSSTISEDFNKNVFFDDDDAEDSSDGSHQISSPFRSFPQKPQCCPVCMAKCVRKCEKEKSKCLKFCKNKCCHDPSEWN